MEGAFDNRGRKDRSQKQTRWLAHSREQDGSAPGDATKRKGSAESATGIGDSANIQGAGGVERRKQKSRWVEFRATEYGFCRKSV